MTDRRGFLRGSVAATTVAAACGPVHAGTSSGGIELAVVDGRFEESLAFGRESARLGIPVRHTNGDVTNLWFGELDDRWKMRPVAIAGLTGHGALFCLERWAWEHRMRVVLRVDHLRKASGEVLHSVLASDPQALRAQLQGSEVYPAAVARAAVRYARGGFQVVSPTGPAVAPNDPEPLVSWVIAPVLVA